MLAVLRQRNFALLWIGSLISRLGDWMLIIAFPYYVYQHTGSSLATGTIFIAETMPEILLGSIAGVYVDRWDRRKMMVAVDLSRAAILLLLLTVRSQDALWVIYLVACVQTSLAQFFIPASGALLPRVVGEEHLMAANSLRAVMANVAQVVGPALGGVVLGLLGLTGVIFIDAGSFIFSAVMIALVRVPAAPAEAVMGEAAAIPVGAHWLTLWREWLDGLRIVYTSRMLIALFVISSLTMLAQGFMSVLWVPFVRGMLHGNALTLGWIATAQGVGGIMGGLIAGIIGTIGRPRHLVVVGAMATGILFLAMIQSRTVLPILILSACLGLPLLVFEVTMGTLLQTNVSDRYRGRVLGAYGTTGSLLLLAAIVLASLLGDSLGVVPLLDLAGGFFSCAGMLALLLLPHATEISARNPSRDVPMHRSE